MRLSTHLQTIAVKARGSIPTRPLGKTGLNVTILGLGGESVIKLQDKYNEAVELIRAAYEMGINYFDTAPEYYPSEVRLGDALSDVRKNVIIATKTHDRTASGTWRLLEKSLNNLKTNYIDIWQLHHLDHKEEVKTALGPDGAIEALQQAKEQGVVRFIGITGHYDHVPLCYASDRYPFDTILMAINAADPHVEDSFIKTVLPHSLKKGIGIIAMKVYGRGRIFDPVNLNTPADALNYVLSGPISTAIVGHDNIRQLVENVKIAQDFKPLTPTQMSMIEEKTKTYANLATFFRKGNEQFNPWWGPYKSHK